MTHPFSDIEIAIHRLHQDKLLVSEQQETIRRLSTRGHPTDLAVGLLKTLTKSLELSKSRLNALVVALPSYRSHLMSDGDVEAIQTHECANDAQAILLVTIMLDSRPAHIGAEIWHGNRLVARIPPRTKPGFLPERTSQRMMARAS
jgi:hypothetical protein